MKVTSVYETYTTQHVPDTFLRVSRPTTAREKLDLLTRRISEASFTSISASFSIFQNALILHLQDQPDVVEQLTYTLLFDLATQPHWQDKVPSLNTESKSHIVSHIVSRCLTQNSKTTLPTFTPLFRGVLERVPQLMERLWLGIYCGAINGIATEFLEDNSLLTQNYQLYRETKPRGKIDILIHKAKEQLLSLQSRWLERASDADAMHIAMCQGTLEWTRSLGGQRGLNTLHRLVAERLQLPQRFISASVTHPMHFFADLSDLLL